MTSISSSHTISVNVSAPQHTIVQVKPVTHIQRVVKTEPVIENIKILEVVRPVTNTQTVVRAENITKVQTIPEIVNRQDVQTVVVAPVNTSSTQVDTGSHVDFYA